MKKIGFIGAFDKSYLLLCVAKVLAYNGRSVLIIDNTAVQKCRYVVPAVEQTPSYITEFEGIDVAVGFNSEEEIQQYGGNLNYDYILIDTDNYPGIVNFGVQESEKIFFVTSFDVYSLKKGIEAITPIEEPIKLTKIFYAKEIHKEEEEYFDYLALGLKVEWNEEKVYFPLENGDGAAMQENQRVSKIKYRNLSNAYRENIVYIVINIENSISEREIRNIIKNA